MRTCRGTKKIQGCGKEKPLTDFHRAKFGYRSYACKDCRNKDKREKYHKEKLINNIASMRW